MADHVFDDAASAEPGLLDPAGAAVPSKPPPSSGPGRRRLHFPRLRGSGRRLFSPLSRRDKIILALMVGVPLIIDLLLIWGPTIVAIGLSFTNWTGIGPITGKNFVGIDEYQKVWAYPFFMPALTHNLIWLAFLMLIATPLGILMAVVLDSDIKGSRFYQSVFYTPVVLSLAVIGLIWQLQYAPDVGQGFINSLLAHIPRLPFTHFLPDISNTDWVGDSSVNLFAALIAASWRHVGYITILYLAGLKSFDPQLREAAAIDGANARQTFFHVVFPVLRPINVVIIVITAIEALRAFDIAYIFNGGKSGLELLSTLITNNGLSESPRVGFSSAIAVVLLVVSLGPIVVFLTRMLREDDK